MVPSVAETFLRRPRPRALTSLRASPPRRQNCNIRVLEPEKLESTKRLQEDCVSFVSKVDELNESLTRLSGLLEGHAAKVESAKLQAVGLRNRASAAEDYEKMRRAEDQSIIAEKQRDLEVRRSPPVDASLPRGDRHPREEAAPRASGGGQSGSGRAYVRLCWGAWMAPFAHAFARGG